MIANRLAEWRRLLRGSTTQARAVVQRIVVGRIVFTPSGNGYTFEAPTRFDKLFSGIAVPRPPFIPVGNEGWEHFGPEDTFEVTTVGCWRRFPLNGWRPHGKTPRCLDAVAGSCGLREAV